MDNPNKNTILRAGCRVLVIGGSNKGRKGIVSNRGQPYYLANDFDSRVLIDLDPLGNTTSDPCWIRAVFLKVIEQPKPHEEFFQPIKKRRKNENKQK